MTYFTLADARRAGEHSATFSVEGAGGVLRKEAARSGPFDIFLSHTFRDRVIVLGVKRILERSGKTVYVDWIDDPLLDRTKVSASTADQLRKRMQACRSLVYAASSAAQDSRWMPWELGYFDGRKGPEAVAVMRLPEATGRPVGQEYLDLYPQVEHLVQTPGAVGYQVPQVTRRQSGRTMVKSVDSLVTARSDWVG